MDYSKEKLKSRLNVKFEPLYAHHRKSQKKLQTLSKKIALSKQESQGSIMSRNRSASTIKLPSLDNKIRAKNSALDRSDRSESIIAASELQQRIKSLKTIPKIKVDRNSSIHETITYLMKNEILTVPKIVAVLRKTESDEFLYMRVIGIYEYQVCDQKHKGDDYVTVSKNGMVCNGVLISFEQLLHEFEVFKKVRNVHFFRYFTKIKYLRMWEKGTKKARFLYARRRIAKLLHLDDEQLLNWKIELVEYLLVNSEGGWLNSKWIPSLTHRVTQTKQRMISKLSEICLCILKQFDLPISTSTSLMNQVLGNMHEMNVSFEKKLRIEYEIEKFYKFGKSLEQTAIMNIGYFVIRHLESLITKVTTVNQQYIVNILEELERLDMEEQTYAQKRQSIFINNFVSFDINFCLYYNQTDQVLSIKPDPMDIYRDNLSHIRRFIKNVDAVGFNYITDTEQFAFIEKILLKGQNEQPEEDSQQEIKRFRNYVFSISQYHPLINDLQFCYHELQETFERRIRLFTPFLNIYNIYLIKLHHLQTSAGHENTLPSCEYETISSEQSTIEQALKFMQKMHEGEYFMFGYLTISELKKQIITAIQEYQQQYQRLVPKTVIRSKIKLAQILSQHLTVLSKREDTPESYICIDTKIEQLEYNIIDYSSEIYEIQRIQELYLQNKQMELPSIAEEKKLLHEIRNQIKSFNSTKDDNYIKYKNDLEKTKRALIETTNAYLETSQLYWRQSPNPKARHAEIREILLDLKSIEQQLVRLNRLEDYFAVKITAIDVLEIKVIQYQNLEELWAIYATIVSDEHTYAEALVESIDAKKYKKLYSGFQRTCEKFYKDAELGDLAHFLGHKISDFLEDLIIIQVINNQDLRVQDLEEINDIIERNRPTPIKLSHKQSNVSVDSEKLSRNSQDKQQILTINCRQLTFKEFQQLNIKLLKTQISQIGLKSRKQCEISQTLQQFTKWWKGLHLEYEMLQNHPLIPIYGDNLKAKQEIEQNMTMLLNILNHKYGGFVRKQCTAMLRNLNNLTDLLELAIVHQEKFLTLYPILTSKYAEKQMNAEYKKFDSVLTKTMKNIRVLAKPTEHLNETMRSLLNNHIKHFDSISRVLAQFLQRKRLKFQRFYFLQDYELMEVLVGIATQKNIFRMFDGINGWVVNEDGIKVGVQGIGGESLMLKGWSFKSNSEPEVIFKALEDAIKNNLNSTVRQILYNYEFEMRELREIYATQNAPWMCVYAVEMILYVKQIELNCFEQGINMEAQENLIRESISQAATAPRNKENYLTLMLFLLHFTRDMRSSGVESIFDFTWRSFLRYYYDSNTVKMRALSSEHQWGGEYQGLWSLMVNTSDLRRAHACVLSNLKYGNGVLLQGPSGTGKTQSLKQLARCMGKYCVLFNCSQNVKTGTLQKILAGLCYTASWVCLDELNRLNREIMSVIANQIMSIRNAVASKKQRFNFVGKQIQLREGIGIFSTINPIYLKRAKITESLKMYFRVITVNIPDYSKILEVMLYSLNFNEADELAEKIDHFFKNLAIQLNLHEQYDFGLRAMKFLVYNLSKYRRESEEGIQNASPGINAAMTQKQISKDQQIFRKALNATFLPRLHNSDLEKFCKIVEDSFKFNLNEPKITEQNTHKPETIKCDIEYKLKTMQTSPQTGIIVFGPLSAKSTIIELYAHKLQNLQLQRYMQNTHKALKTPRINLDQAIPEEQFRDINRIDFNPSSVDLQHLIGSSMHGRWQYGIVQKIARESLQQTNRTHLLVLDSVLKSEIIESFNTLLDETRTLTLINGTRLKVRQNLKIVMETPNLKQTSPATITRCNIIYMSEKDVDKQKLIRAQLPKQLSEPITLRLMKLFEGLTHQQIRANGRLYRFLFSYRNHNDSIKQWREQEILGMEKSIIFAAKLLGHSHKMKEFITKDKSLPSRKSPFDYILSFKKSAAGEFIELLETSSPSTLYGAILLNSKQRQFCEWINQRAIRKLGSHVLWYGVRNSGKSCAIECSLKGHDRVKIPLTRHLSTLKFTKSIESKLHIEKQQNLERTYPNQKLLIYVDNLHLGTEDVIENLRFVMERGKIMWAKSLIEVPPMTIIAESKTVNQQNSLLTEEQSRVLRHFNTLKMPQLPEYQLRSFHSEVIRHQLTHTRALNNFKSLVQIEIQRFSTFIQAYIEKKNKYLSEINQPIMGQCELIPTLRKIKHLDDKNGKQVTDFIGLLFHYLKKYENYHEHSFPMCLSLAYHQIYKTKFTSEFEQSLKNNSFYTQLGSKSKQSTPYEKLQKIINEQIAVIITKTLNKPIYIPKHIVQELINVIMTLQEDSQGYLLFGSSNYGKKTIYKLSCQLTRAQFIELNINSKTNNLKEYKKIYYDSLINSLQKKTTVCIVININELSSKQLPQIDQFVNFVELCVSGYPATQLFETEDTDYMFSTIADYVTIPNYSISSKTYEQVCQEYINYASRRVKLLFTSSQMQKTNINACLQWLNSYQTIYKSTMIRYLEQYPIESIYSITKCILQEQLQLSTNPSTNNSLSQIPSVLLKVYKFLSGFGEQLHRKQLNYFMYNHFSHYKLVKKYTEIYQKSFVQMKQNEDILSRSIAKVYDTKAIIAKLKEQQFKIQPDIEIKKNSLMELVPVLGHRKQAYDALKLVVNHQNKQIQYRKQEINEIMAQAQELFAQVQRLLTETLDSLVTVKKVDLYDLKNIHDPHPLIRFTIENVVMLLGENGENWSRIRKTLSDSSLILRLKACNPTKADCLRVSQRISHNFDWNYDSVSKVASGIRYLVIWVRNMLHISEIKEQASATESRATELQKDLQHSQSAIGLKLSQLAQKEQSLKQIEHKNSNLQKELRKLQLKLLHNKNRHENAECIWASLESSIPKWQQTAAYYKQNKTSIESYSLFMSLYLVVFPNVTHEEQQHLMSQALTIVDNAGLTQHPKSFKLDNLLRDVQNFYIHRQFKNKLSHAELRDHKKIQLLYHYGSKPVLLDPDNRAIKWLRKFTNISDHENRSIDPTLIIAKQSFTGCGKLAEQAMINGIVLLILIQDQMDTFSSQLLRCLQSCSSQNSPLIEYNKNIFNINPNFRLLFISTSPNSNPNPGLSANHQLINFQISKTTLKMTLLQQIVKQENQYLFNRLQIIETNRKENEYKLQEIEDAIIRGLITSSNVSCVDNQSFISVLQSYRVMNQHIFRAQAAEKQPIQANNEYYKTFESICEQAAVIYLSLQDMSKINSMLVWDVEIFVGYFIDACTESISIPVTKQEQQDELLSNEKFIDDYEFEQYHPTESRPSSSLSMISGVTSRVTNQEIKQPSKQKQEPSQSQIDPKQQITFSAIVPSRQLLINDNQRGTMNPSRQSKTLTTLTNWLKKSMNEQQRKIWSLLLSLIKEDRKSIKVLLANIAHLRKTDINIDKPAEDNPQNAKNNHNKSHLRTVIEQNNTQLITDNIRSYFLQSAIADNMEFHANKIVMCKCPFQQYGQHFSRAEILVLCLLVKTDRFMPLVEELIGFCGYEGINQYSETGVGQWLQNSDCRHPIMLMMGEDSLPSLTEYFSRKKYKNVILIPMGEQQQKVAESLLEKETKKQNIIIIHNLHISKRFLSYLTKTIQHFEYGRSPHKDFRLILITGQLEGQVELASVCHKYKIQQPSGLQNQMLYLYNKSHAYLDLTVNRHKLLYSLCMMHSMINEMQNYEPFGWNMFDAFTFADFVQGLRAVKQLVKAQTEISEQDTKQFECSIDGEELKTKVKAHLANGFVDLKGLRYLIGQINYVGKMTNELDRNKMRLIISKHINEQIFASESIRQRSVLPHNEQSAVAEIKRIPQHNPVIFGFHPQTQTKQQNPVFLHHQLASIFLHSDELSNALSQQSQTRNCLKVKITQIEPINHKLAYINSEISKFNTQLKNPVQYQQLSSIQNSTRIFNLRAFEYPKQLFSSSRMETAEKYNIAFENVEIVWSLTPKENMYGIFPLKLQGAGTNNGLLVDGLQEKQVTLFFQTVPKKKGKDIPVGKQRVEIPLYLETERSGVINSFGENSNLLAIAVVDSKQDQAFWTLRGTAFIAM